MYNIKTWDHLIGLGAVRFLLSCYRFCYSFLPCACLGSPLCHRLNAGLRSGFTGFTALLQELRLAPTIDHSDGQDGTLAPDAR